MQRAVLEELLETVPEARFAALVDFQGALLKSTGVLAAIDGGHLATAMTEQVEAAAREQHPMTSGQIGQFVVATDLYTVFLAPISDRHRLLLVLGSGGSDGRARFELRRACRKLQAQGA